jgi:putative membrane protein
MPNDRLVQDALLAYAHYISIFALASVIIAELVLLRKAMLPDLARRMRIIDRWYGIIAGLVILTGVLRLNLGLKGSQFYVHNPVFWTKMALFVAVGLISIVPTIAYIRWNRRLAPDGSILLADGEFNQLRTLLWVQIILFLFIPLCAVFMARGL